MVILRNKKFIKNKKASTPIGVGLLVMLTIVLVFFTLYSFNIKNKDIQEKINYPNSLDKIYVREELVNFYANEILDNSIAKGKDNLKENVKAELIRYKDKEGKYLVEGLKQLEEQTDKIKVEGSKVSWKFNMTLQYSEENLKISYNYNKDIEKKLS